MAASLNGGQFGNVFVIKKECITENDVLFETTLVLTNGMPFK